MSQRSPLRVAILQLADRPEGVGTDEVVGYTVKQVGRAIEEMMAAGQLFKGLGRGHWRRYYTSKASADMRTELEINRRMLTAPKTKFFSATWDAEAQPIITDKTKFTRCPPSRIGEFVTNTHGDW